jgi:hypothetical protein
MKKTQTLDKNEWISLLETNDLQGSGTFYPTLTLMIDKLT